MKPVCCFLLLILPARWLHAQRMDETFLIQLLSNSDKTKIAVNDSLLIAYYEHADSSVRVPFLHLLNRQTSSSNPYTAARSLAWKGVVLYRYPFNKNDAALYMVQAINKAIESGDEYLMVQCFELYGDHCLSTNKPETALFYFLKSAGIREKLGDQYFYYKNMNLFGALGHILFRMQEYEQAIHYLKTGISMPGKIKYQHTTTMNTIALAYQRMARYDSALYWYQQSLESAHAKNDPVWVGIISGNIGSLYFERKEDDKALPLLWKDYHTTINVERNNAGNTLHRIALIYLRRNKTDSAMLLARQGLQIVSSYKPVDPWYVHNACMALSEIFKKKGNTDSAFFYADRYHYLKDSLNLQLARNRADVVQAKLDFEKASNLINSLVDEKRSEKARRNLLLAGILLLMAVGWFYFRWQRQRHNSRQQALLFEKEKAESDMQYARKQLEEFTQHSIQKNELIEKLREQLEQQHMQINEELLQQTILTENDWLRFRDMFDKAYPGFIEQLKTSSPDISTAEIRLATLIRLQLGNKHIASMLGIGADAVRKTKSRLRHRLGLPPETAIEDFIKTIRPTPSA